MPDRLPTFQEAQVLKKIEACQTVVKALFYHLAKHNLDTRDGLLVLASAFAFIRDNQPTVDAQTEIKILFLSMIENLPDRPVPSNIMEPQNDDTK